MKYEIMMVTKLLLVALTVMFNSCHEAEDILYSLDKLSYQSFLRNESGQDVTVIMRPSKHLNPEECTWHVPCGSAIEIPDTERWGLMQRVYESDTVFFLFEDGTMVQHYFITENYPSDKHKFIPQENNIFSTGLGIPDQEDSWTTIKIRPKKYRCEYIIK